ncbi:hypothetical protein [Nocardia sp. NPDC050175]
MGNYQQIYDFIDSDLDPAQICHALGISE